MPRGLYIHENANRIVLTVVKLQALSLYTLKQLTYTEIGKQQNVSRHSAYQRVQSAIDIIREACEKELRLCHK